MTADETAICNYLKGFPGMFVSGREICRRAAGKRRATEEPRWALPVLKGLVEQKIVESDATGHFRLIQVEQKKAAKRWVSPQVLRVLKASGKNFDGVFEIEVPLESVPSLRKAGQKIPRKDSRENSGQRPAWPHGTSQPRGTSGEGFEAPPEWPQSGET